LIVFDISTIYRCGSLRKYPNKRKTAHGIVSGSR